MNTITHFNPALNPRHNGAWKYEFALHARSGLCDGRPVAVYGHDLKNAIREARKHVSNAYSLAIIRRTR